MYTVRILKATTRELERLDKAVGRRVAQRITWLAENVEQIRLEALKGGLGGGAVARPIQCGVIIATRE